MATVQSSPASQTAHVEDPATLVEPVGQLVHAESPALLNVPTGQSGGSVPVTAGSEQFFPAGQMVQLAAPALL